MQAQLSASKKQLESIRQELQGKLTQSETKSQSAVAVRVSVGGHEVTCHTVRLALVSLLVLVLSFDRVLCPCSLVGPAVSQQEV